MTLWRDVPSADLKVGFTIYRRGLTLYLGRRVYRMLWRR